MSVTVTWTTSEKDPQVIEVLMTREEIARISKRNGVPIGMVIATFLEDQLAYADR